MKRFALAALAAVFVVVGGGRQALTPGPGEARAAGGRCYMAFIHGSGDNFFDENPRASARESPLSRYWSSDGSNFNSFAYYAARVWAGEQGCLVWRVGYDGNQQWWSDRAAGKVAASLHDFIDQNNIPDGKLILIAHSMGGVVARYVLGNGAPQAPYYNEYAWQNARMDYDLVRRKTAYLITLQAPHTGTQAADSLYGDADHGLSNGGGNIAKLFNIKDPTPATSTMTRAYMEAAGALGGEMADEGRLVNIYTVSGGSTEDESGTNTDTDDDLSLAWVMLCYKRGAANSWGAACQWDVWNFETIPGDGLVERRSGHGQWLRPGGSGGPNGAPLISGALQPWLDITHNHNHGRWDDLIAPIVDYVALKMGQHYLGQYVGANRPGVGN
jgi:hypothetical protein